LNLEGLNEFADDFARAHRLFHKDHDAGLIGGSSPPEVFLILGGGCGFRLATTVARNCPAHRYAEAAPASARPTDHP
jgi:hypothetical protein